jgi:hypothetical protein
MELFYQNAKVIEALAAQNVTLLTFFVRTLLARDKIDLEIIEGAIEQSLRTLNELYSSLRTNAPALFEKILVSRFERIEVDKAIFANSDENVEEEQEKVRKRHNVIVSTFSNNLLDPLEKHVKAVQALHEEALLAFSRLEDQKIAPGATGQQNAKSTSTGTLYQASLKL